MTPSPGTACRLAVETTATPAGARYLSDLVRLYLEGGVGLDPGDPDVAAFRLAVVEAVTNVHRHAYAGREPGPVSLEIRREEDSLVAVIGDRGPRFDPGADGRGRLPRPEDLAEGGYGLGIVHRVMDEIRHRHAPEEGNELTLAKRMW